LVIKLSYNLLFQHIVIVSKSKVFSLKIAIILFIKFKVSQTTFHRKEC
jgi:hypothetical protein